MKRGIGRKDISPTPLKPRFKFCDRFSPDQRATRNELRLIEVRCKRRNSRKCTGCCARHGGGRKKKKRKLAKTRALELERSLLTAARIAAGRVVPRRRGWRRQKAPHAIAVPALLWRIRVVLPQAILETAGVSWHRDYRERLAPPSFISEADPTGGEN